MCSNMFNINPRYLPYNLWHYARIERRNGGHSWFKVPFLFACLYILSTRLYILPYKAKFKKVASDGGYRCHQNAVNDGDCPRQSAVIAGECHHFQNAAIAGECHHFQNAETGDALGNLHRIAVNADGYGYRRS